MMDLFFAILLVGFIWLSYRKPLWGVGAVIVLLPSYLWCFNILGIPTTFLELLIVSLFIVWLLKEKKYKAINFSLQKTFDNQVPKALRYLLGLWSLAAILALLTNFTYASLGLWRAYFLEPLMFFLVFVYTVKNKVNGEAREGGLGHKKDWTVIINSLALLLAWLFTVAMYQNFTTWNYIDAYNFPNVKRLTGPFAYPNALSLLTAPLTALFAGLWIYTKDKLFNWHYLILFIFGLVLAIMTVSQGAMLAIIFSLFLALILAKKLRKIAIPVIILGLISILLVLPKIDINPELNLQSSSLDIRLNQWQETSALLADNFLLGTGLNGYQNALEAYHHTEWLEIYLYPHNIFLNFWIEIGLLGLLVFISLIIYVILLLKDIFKANNNLAWPLSMMWLTWFVHGLVDVPYFKNDLSVLFFILLGLTILAVRDNKSNSRLL